MVAQCESRSTTTNVKPSKPWGWTLLIPRPPPERVPNPAAVHATAFVADIINQTVTFVLPLARPSEF
jgi:hypothetical protein